MRIIIVCGSNKFIDEMISITEKLALERNCMITLIELSKQSKDFILRKNLRF